MDTSSSEGREIQLSVGECLMLLATRRVGRLVMSEPNPHVRPLNFVLAGDEILVRTDDPFAEGQRVAFEVDQIDEIGKEGWSVVVEGRCTSVATDEVAVDVRSLLSPWAPGTKLWLTRILIDVVGGRWVRAERTGPGFDQHGYI